MQAAFWSHRVGAAAGRHIPAALVAEPPGTYWLLVDGDTVSRDVQVVVHADGSVFHDACQGDGQGAGSLSLSANDAAAVGRAASGCTGVAAAAERLACVLAVLDTFEDPIPSCDS